MIQVLQDIALFTMNRQMAEHYVHGTHSLFYDDYYAEIFSIVAKCRTVKNRMLHSEVKIAP